MEVFGAGVAQALVAMCSPLRRSVAAEQQRVNTDEENLERGLPLVAMNASGVRQRNILDHGQEIIDERDSSPTATTTGALTPSSTEEAPQTPEPFTKLSWRRMSSGLGSSLFSRASAGSGDNNEHVCGHDMFRQEKREHLNQAYTYARLLTAWVPVEDFPNGFPRLSAFVSSDPDFSIVRAFKTIHNRIILQYEVEITELEKALFKLDTEDEINPQMVHRLRRTKHKEGWDSRQRDLLKELRTKIIEYDEIVLYHARMQELGRPPKRNHIHYWNFIWTTKPLAQGYYDYVYWADDFVTLAGNRTNYFQDLIQEHMFRWPRSLVKWFLRKSDKEKPTENKAGTYYSERKLGIASQMFLVSVAVGMLLLPCYLLFLVRMSHPKMAGVVTAFLFPFSFIMSAVTKIGSAYEVFVATAT
ncbi:uncharacterized protein PAC_01514 [Phialocephala subalpina]|uniref:DUF6594 domain-containing protein n=1 Tax=Phialocephala subalpina TaxID=576137 RepID=A0A1L7WFV9_9HELO|nr:uncharacterized protein PAC_01514 [Phialocephala subalpina]